MLEQVGFYHLEKTGVFDTLPTLIDKIYSLGLRCCVYHENQEFLEKLDKVLWTYTPLAFIPHGLEGEEHALETPVWLSSQLTFSNNPDVFIALSSYDSECLSSDIKRVVDMFEGKDEQALGDARKRWKSFQQANVKCIYWTQTLQGKWEKTAETG